MKLAGSRSWTFRHGIAQPPHAAVYVRDAAGRDPGEEVTRWYSEGHFPKQMAGPASCPAAGW